MEVSEKDKVRTCPSRVDPHPTPTPRNLPSVPDTGREEGTQSPKDEGLRSQEDPR